MQGWIFLICVLSLPRVNGLSLYLFSFRVIIYKFWRFFGLLLLLIIMYRFKYLLTFFCFLQSTYFSKVKWLWCQIWGCTMGHYLLMTVWPWSPPVIITLHFTYEETKAKSCLITQTSWWKSQNTNLSLSYSEACALSFYFSGPVSITVECFEYPLTSQLSLVFVTFSFSKLFLSGRIFINVWGTWP